MRAWVKVNDYELTGCTANPEPSEIQARLLGFYFNAGPASTGRVNDIGASVRLIRASDSSDAPGVLRVEGLVFQCTTEDCNSGTLVLGSVDLGTTAVGTLVQLKVEWEQTSKRFNFYYGNIPVQRITYEVSDTSPPTAGHARLIGTRTNVANCLTAPRAMGYVSASFDHFAVNQSAAP
jgi:hypothetical protein